MKLETNPLNPLHVQMEIPSGATLMITAPRSDYWLFRVKLAADVTLRAVPEFGGIRLELEAQPPCSILVPMEIPASEGARRFRAHCRAAALPARSLMQGIRLLQQAAARHRAGA